MSINCQFCNRDFKTNSSLYHHQRTAKYCLIKQGLSNAEFKCEHCDKLLTTRERLAYHLQSCKSKVNRVCNSELEKHKLSYEKILTDFENLKENVSQTKNELYQKETELKQKDEYIFKLEEMLKKANETIAEIAKQPTTSNNTTTNNNTLINRFDINDIEKISNVIDKHLTTSVLKRGQEGLADMLKTHLLQDENGQLLYECTDVARQQFEFRNPDGHIETDPKANKLLRNIGKSGIWKTAHTVGKKIWELPDGKTNNDAQTVFMPQVTEVLNVDNDSKKLRSRLATITARQKKVKG
jgi:hypothetical protein